MISLLEARPGQGKSVVATYLIDDYMSRGYTVGSNLPVDLDGMQLVNSWDDVLALMKKHLEYVEERKKEGKNPEGGLVFILDELGMWIDARQWDSLPTFVKFILRQHRKFGVDIIGFAQSVKDIDVTYRRLVQNLGVVSKWGVAKIPFGGVHGLFRLSYYDSDDIDKDKEARRSQGFLAGRFIYADPFVFTLFDSWHIHWPSDEGYEVKEQKFRRCSLGHLHHA
jgi:hypothetical protein